MVLAALSVHPPRLGDDDVSQVTPEYLEEGRAHILQDKVFPPYVAVFRIHGPFLFGATDKIQPIVDGLDELPPVVVIRLRNMTAIDGTGVHALEELADRLHASGRDLILCGAREQPAAVMRRAEFHAHVGEANICPSIEAALARAEVLQRRRTGPSAAASG